jgi:NhaB family Na+:H+ antiporter
VSLPVLAIGLATCLVLEKFRLFSYGAEMPRSVYEVLHQHDADQRARMTQRDKVMLLSQGAVCMVLIIALATHVAEVGLLGLAAIVLAAALNGVSEEHKLGKAFEAGLPFASLLVVFFVIVAMIHSQHLFEPVIAWVLSMEGYVQLLMVYLTNGALSAISDNVFVATVYIDQVKAAFENGRVDRATLDAMAGTIVMGTGIPAMATPNGHAALLFLLTSAIAGMVKLSYARMAWMCLPYMTVATVVVGLLLPTASGL